MVWSYLVWSFPAWLKLIQLYFQILNIYQKADDPHNHHRYARIYLFSYPYVFFEYAKHRPNLCKINLIIRRFTILFYAMTSFRIFYNSFIQNFVICYSLKAVWLPLWPATFMLLPRIIVMLFLFSFSIFLR